MKAVVSHYGKQSLGLVLLFPRWGTTDRATYYQLNKNIFQLKLFLEKSFLFSFGRFLSLGFSKNFRENFHPWEIIISLQDTKQIFFNIYVYHLLYPPTSRWTLCWYCRQVPAVLCVYPRRDGPGSRKLRKFKMWNIDQNTALAQRSSSAGATKFTRLNIYLV